MQRCFTRGIRTVYGPYSYACGGQTRWKERVWQPVSALWPEPPAIQGLRDCSAEFWMTRKRRVPRTMSKIDVLRRPPTAALTGIPAWFTQISCKKHLGKSRNGKRCARWRNCCVAEDRASACRTSGDRPKVHPCSRHSTARAFSRCRRQESRWAS